MDELEENKFKFDKDIILLIAVVGLVILFIILLLLPNPSNQNKTSKYLEYAKIYVKENQIIGQKFISLYDLEASNIYTATNCNKASGIFYNAGKYEEYVMCNDYYSEAIKKLPTENEYIALNGSSFYITDQVQFEDPGYTLKNTNLKVKTTTNFKSEYGLYDFVYSVFLNDKLVSNITRKILYTNYNSNYLTDAISLNGDNPLYLFKNQSYVEPGYYAFDKNGNNQNYKVQVAGQVQTKIPGAYEVTYTLSQIQVKRKVIVVDLEAEFIDEDDDYTKEPYDLLLLIKGNDYLKTVLPNGNEAKSKTINYEVSVNGKYEFTIYDKYNHTLKLIKNVKNIDAEAPTGTCINRLDLGKTYVTVTASDVGSGIYAYTYNNTETNFTTKNATYEYAGIYETVKVTVTDKADNKTIITCSKTGTGAFPQIKPSSNSNIISQADSPTLKVTIEHFSDYYLSRVWVLDPYNQIKKGVTSAWGVKRETPFTIINREITTNNLQNKIVIGINASGFYEAGSWNPNSESYNQAYNRTTEGGLVITNGQVIRNWYYDSAVDRARNPALYAISKSGHLDTYANSNALSENERKVLFDSIIAKGYLNTWVFRPVIMLNGELASKEILGTFLEGSGKRNIFCQINTNNFAIVSTTSSDYKTNRIKNLLTSLQCDTAVNMDGGGSVALVYKGQNETLKVITGGSREVVDTLYFTEK